MPALTKPTQYHTISAHSADVVAILVSGSLCAPVAGYGSINEFAISLAQMVAGLFQTAPA